MPVVIWKEDKPPIQRTLDATYRMDEVAETEFEKLINDWWRRVRDLAKSLCREMGAYDTGTLYNTIRIIYAPMTPVGFGAFYEVTAGPRSINVDRMLVAGGLLINPNTGRICDYAQVVHDGGGIGRNARPREFMTIALEIMEPELMTIMEGMVSQQEREWGRE